VLYLFSCGKSEYPPVPGMQSDALLLTFVKYLYSSSVFSRMSSASGAQQLEVCGR
jgi:hypothetical protein